MTSRGKDHFRYVISSNGCKTIYPSNSPTDFRIALTHPIEFGDEQNWEVGLESIEYPYIWENNSPTPLMGYMLSNDKIKEISFPLWQCESLADIVQYMKSKLPSEFYTISQNDSGKFHFECKNKTYSDIGFSKEMHDILGLEYNVSYPGITFDDLIERANLRNIMSEFWKNKINPLDMDLNLYTSLKLIGDDMTQIMTKLAPYIDSDKLKTSTKYDKPINLNRAESDMLSRLAPVFNLSATALFLRNVKYFYSIFKTFYAKPLPPTIIEGLFKPYSNRIENIQIHADFIQPYDINNETCNILRSIIVDGTKFKTSQKIYTTPLYYPVKKEGKIDTFHVYITRADNTPVSFDSGYVSLALHFRRIPTFLS